MDQQLMGSILFTNWLLMGWKLIQLTIDWALFWLLLIVIVDNDEEDGEGDNKIGDAEVELLIILVVDQWWWWW